MVNQLADKVISVCREVARLSERLGETTRTFLCPPARECQSLLRGWMMHVGMDVHVDAAGNLRGLFGHPESPRLLIGSHLDTVPRAGAFDGVLGVVIAVALVENLGEQLPFAIEVVGFSEEEGVRFGVPFLGSKALVRGLTDAELALRDSDGFSVADALRAFGLDPNAARTPLLSPKTAAYLEFHVEQGPMLEALGLPLAVVDAIVGQSRAAVTFEGQANHAGTTPTHLRRDALAGAAQWIGIVEADARRTLGLVATSGRLEVSPNGANVIAGRAVATLDVRHAEDETRRASFERLLASAEEIAARRGLGCRVEKRLEQAAVRMDGGLVGEIEDAFDEAKIPVFQMASGAGHDAMIAAERLPSAMIFLRSPGGLSHCAEEAVLEEDVAAALHLGQILLRRLTNWKPLRHGTS